MPTAGDDIVFEPGADWFTRQQSVTINDIARARDLKFYHYGSGPSVFQIINVLPGADYSLRDEYVDQSIAHGAPVGAYNQSGGNHTVDNDFRYTTAYGEFRMTGGTFTVGGTLLAAPENGSLEITGTSRVIAHTLGIGWDAWTPDDQAPFTLGGSAEVRVVDELFLATGSSLSISRPIYMEGANFTYADRMDRIWMGENPGLDQMHLIFEGDLGDISTFKADWPNQGCDPTNWLIGFDPFGNIELGGDQPAHLQLTSEPPYGTFNALYVNDFTMGPSSILDLNGHSLYVLSDNGYIPVLRGAWGEGLVIDSTVPAPGAILLGALGTGLVCGWLRRKRA